MTDHPSNENGSAIPFSVEVAITDNTDKVTVTGDGTVYVLRNGLERPVLQQWFTTPVFDEDDLPEPG